TTSEDGSRLDAESLPINIALLERRPAHRRLRIRGLDGEWRVVDASAFPIEGQGGRHLGAVAIFWEAEPGGLGRKGGSPTHGRYTVGNKRIAGCAGARNRALRGKHVLRGSAQRGWPVAYPRRGARHPREKR